VSAYQLDFACDDGFAGFVRLEFRPDEKIAWYWTYLVGIPGVPGIVVVRDHEVPLPRQRLEIRADSLWAELWCEKPREHWTFGLEAFGVRIDRAEDARRRGGEIGDRVAVGLDLEWEAPNCVHGDVLVARDRFAVDARGWFYDDGDEPPPIDGEPIARVVIPEAGERSLVRARDGLRWTPIG
jgi:hypothetical protein